MITTVFLPGDRPVIQNMLNASVQNNFYTAIGNDGAETDVAEQAVGYSKHPPLKRGTRSGQASGRYPTKRVRRSQVMSHCTRYAAAATAT
jgi:hypothetical protein